MAIVSSAVIMEGGIACDMIHMSELHMSQAKKSHLSTLNMAISLAYRKYSETDTTLTVAPEVRTITIDDYASEATALAMQGDMSLVDAMAALEKAIAVIISHSDLEGTCEVV